MILTPIAGADLGAALDRFERGLKGALPRAAFRLIRRTSPDRAEGAAAEEHRRIALGLARACGIPTHPPHTPSPFHWDGRALNATSESYVILHEIAHFRLAPPRRRRLVEFGLGPGPDTGDRAAAERAAMVSPVERDEDEAMASLLGVLWEARLRQPALASFLDQNWLEGGERAPAHFMRVLVRLRFRSLLSPPLPAGQSSRYENSGGLSGRLSQA